MKREPEALHIILQLELMRMVDATGEAVAGVLDRAMQKAASVVATAAGPLSPLAVQMRQAEVAAIFQAAADESYAVYVERVEADAERWVEMSEQEVAAELDRSETEQAKEARNKAVVALALLLPRKARVQQAIREASRKGALELTVAAQEQPYSLDKVMARAFILPDGTPVQMGLKAASVQATVLFERRMRSAVLNNQTPQDLARQLLEEGQRPVSNLRNESRTGAQSVANGVNQSVMAESLVRWVMHVSTLDSRTTEYCRRQNGRVYRLEDAPYLPAHRNCRSVYRAVAGGTGTRPPDGRTPVDWLEAQPADVQDRVLGRRAAQAFRETGSLVAPSRGRR